MPANSNRVARVRQCYSRCERAPATTRLVRSSPLWQPAYNHCTSRCSSNGDYQPYRIGPDPMDCVRMTQLEMAGYKPSEIPHYDPRCHGRFAGMGKKRRAAPKHKAAPKRRAAPKRKARASSRRRYGCGTVNY
jgi:hypothetical protein